MDLIVVFTNRESIPKQMFISRLPVLAFPKRDLVVNLIVILIRRVGYLSECIESLLVHVLEPAHEWRVGQQLGVVAVGRVVRGLVAEVDQRVVQVPSQRRR